jgi:hypothetical protein
VRRLNLLVTLTSLDVLFVTIERFSFTTKIILYPYNFLRLHELIQMTVIILISAILPFFILKELSNNFESLKTKKGLLLGAIFIAGIYFYSTGNGLHEVASYLFNSFCDVSKITSTVCGSMFFNDYYTGNILYFAGAFLFTIPLIIFERMNPNKSFRKKDWIVLGINGFIYALTIFAYAAFDKVLVGLWYGIITSAVLLLILFRSKIKYKYLPYSMYSIGAYLLGTVASLIFRFR